MEKFWNRFAAELQPIFQVQKLNYMQIWYLMIGASSESRPPLFFNFRGGLLSSLFSKNPFECLKTAILPQMALRRLFIGW